MAQLERWPKTMSIRTSQRLIAFAFVVVAIAIGSLFVRIYLLGGFSLPVSSRWVLGLAGWALAISACAVVLFHPNPENTFLGRWAFTKEPLLRGTMSPRTRMLVTYAVVACAIGALCASVFFFTGTARVLYDRYLL